MGGVVNAIIPENGVVGHVAVGGSVGVVGVHAFLLVVEVVDGGFVDAVDASVKVLVVLAQHIGG